MNRCIFTTIFVLIQICNENWNELGESKWRRGVFPSSLISLIKDLELWSTSSSRQHKRWWNSHVSTGSFVRNCFLWLNFTRWKKLSVKFFGSLDLFSCIEFGPCYYRQSKTIAKFIKGNLISTILEQ